MIDILVATYNGERYLGAQLDSLIDQTEKDIRILIRDDGSTDRTPEMIADYARRYPEKIEAVSVSAAARGPVGNFMALTRAASADYVMYCDQDDVWYPEKAEKTRKAMAEAEQRWGSQTPILIYSNYETVDKNLTPLPVDERKNQVYRPHLAFNRLLVQNYVTGCTMMVNRALYQKATAADAEILMHDWWFALYASAFGKIVHLDEKLMAYRQHCDQCVGATDVKSFNYRLTKFKDPATRDKKNDYYRQAQAFKAHYGRDLPADQAQILNYFLAIPAKNKWGRMAALIRGKYFKSDFFRILGQFYYI